MEAALTAVNESLMNSPGFEIGNEVALVRRHGTDTVAQSCTMGRKKGSGLYEIRNFDGKEQLAMRKDLQTFNEFQLRGRSLQLPSPGGLRVMSAPTPNQGLRREVMPEDFSLSLTIVLKSTFGKVPEVMQWELFSITCLCIVSLRPR